MGSGGQFARARVVIEGKRKPHAGIAALFPDPVQLFVAFFVQLKMAQAWEQGY